MLKSGSRRLLALLVAASVTALVLTAVTAGPAMAAPGTWLTRINTYRAANGRTRLVEDYQASLVAKRWTLHMAATNRLAHNPLYGIQILAPHTRTGENVGYGSTEAMLFQTFTSSTPHRANLLQPEFNRIGIGQVILRGRLWTTHIFYATR